MSRSQPGRYLVEVLGSWQALEPHWIRMASAATPFQAVPILRSWYASLGQRADVEPLCVRVTDAAAGEDAVLLPLIRRRSAGIRHIEFADLWAIDNNAPALGARAPTSREEGQDLMTALIGALPSCDVITLTKMPATIGGRPNPLVLTPLAQPSEFVRSLCDISGLWDQIFKGFDASLRKNIQRRRRQIEQQGAVKYFVAESMEDRQAVHNRLESFQRKRLEKLQARHVFDEPEHKKFYELLVQSGGENVLMTGIEVNGDIVAASMLVCGSNVASSLRHAFTDGPLEKFGLGIQIIAYNMQIAHERGYGVFDHSIGNTAWKDDFSPKQEPLFELSRAVSALGLAYQMQARVKRTLSAGGQFRERLREVRNSIRQIGARRPTAPEIIAAPLFKDDND